ncbi:13357_t:CDS:1, partial [Dentiscutata heterogama]
MEKDLDSDNKKILIIPSIDVPNPNVLEAVVFPLRIASKEPSTESNMTSLTGFDETGISTQNISSFSSNINDKDDKDHVSSTDVSKLILFQEGITRTSTKDLIEATFENDENDINDQSDDTDTDSQNDEININAQDDEKVKNIQSNTSAKNADINAEDQFDQESSKSVKRSWSIKRVFSRKKKKNKDNQSNDLVKDFMDNATANQAHDTATEQDNQNDQILGPHVIPPELFTENMVTTYFHVIMPKKVFKRKFMVFVIGNIKELGDGRYGIVQLKRYDKNPIYWYSDPISVPINVLEDRPIRYGYFVYKGAKSSLAKKLFNQLTIKSNSSFENIVPDIDVDAENWFWDRNKREFIFRENQYDLWSNTEKYRIKLKDLLKYYPYISIIYGSINDKNLKEKIIEYLDINKRHASILDYDVLERFVFKNFCDSNSIKQNVFLCVLLGYAIKEKKFKNYMPLGYNLPEDFPSIDMLRTFKDISKDDLPHGVIKVLPQVVCTVVLHISTFSTKFEWIKAFEVAPVIDSKYTFLEQFKVPVYTRGNESNFLESLKKFAKPSMDKITNDGTYVKVCKNLLSLCQSIAAIIFLWQSIFHPDTYMYDDLSEYSLNRLNYFLMNDNAKELEKHLKEIPVNFNIDFTFVFRERIFKLLSNFNVSWDKDNIDSILKLLNNARLNWQEDTVLQALGVFSASGNMDLLQSFPIQLVMFLEKDFIDIDSNDKRLGKICTQWFKSALACIKEEQNAPKHIEENFSCTIFHYLSTMYSIMKKYNITSVQLFNAAEEAVKVLKDNVIFDAAVNIGDLKQKELIEIFSHVLKERFDSDVKNSDIKLLSKIMRICKSKGQQLHIPNT